MTLFFGFYCEIMIFLLKVGILINFRYDRSYAMICKQDNWIYDYVYEE